MPARSANWALPVESGLLRRDQIPSFLRAAAIFLASAGLAMRESARFLKPSGQRPVFLLQTGYRRRKFALLLLYLLRQQLEISGVGSPLPVLFRIRYLDLPSFSSLDKSFIRIPFAFSISCVNCFSFSRLLFTSWRGLLIRVPPS